VRERGAVGNNTRLAQFGKPAYRFAALVPAFVLSFLRCLVVLGLWLGAGAAASSAGPAPEEMPDLRSDLHLRLVELLGGPELCGDEGDPDAVLCGGDLLADLIVDPSVLEMSRGACSRLLEALFQRAVCDPSDESCGKLYQGGLPPGAPPRAFNSLSAGVLLALAVDAAPREGRSASARPRDGPELSSRTIAPVPPPPRARLA
jgi:hypothetical protein